MTTILTKFLICHNYQHSEVYMTEKEQTRGPGECASLFCAQEGQQAEGSRWGIHEPSPGVSVAISYDIRYPTQ